MDYSYFTSAPQPYGQFFGVPQSSNSLDQHNSHPQPHLPHLNEYPSQLSAEQYDAAFAAFQQSFQYDPSAFLQQPANTSSAPPLSASPPTTTQPPFSINLPDIDHKNIPPAPNDISPDEPNLGQNRSSSEEKDNLTPQQSRRKAQNRAAQRAFRERKERHVKDLEAKLTNLQNQSANLNGENERLKREIARFATENEILRATSGSQTNGPTPFMTDPDELVGPLGYVPKDNHSGTPSSYGSDLGSKYAHFGTLKMLSVDDETGQPLLGAGATWDYIQSHELFRKGLVDVGDVCERLKNLARCDGQSGPVFQESDVRKAIAESAVAGGRDELI